jgi:hypothetical protein
MELFGDWVKDEWMQSIITWVKTFHEYIFIFLTKQPQNLIKWSPFPDNCWVGVTATNRKMLMEAKKAFNSPITSDGIRARIKFISFEPLLEPIICQHEWIDKTPPHQFRSRTMPISVCSKCGQGQNWGDLNDEFIGSNGKPIIQWLIIGAQTKPYKPPKIEWIQEITEAADRAKIPVFLKDNLKPLLIRNGGHANAGIELLNRDIEHGNWKLRQEYPNEE